MHSHLPQPEWAPQGHQPQTLLCHSKFLLMTQPSKMTKCSHAQYVAGMYVCMYVYAGSSFLSVGMVSHKTHAP